MFGLFKNRHPQCPISEEMRIWMENAFIWLIKEFGEEKVIQAKQLTPSKQDLPISFTGTESDAYQLLTLITKQMDSDPTAITLSFYDQRLIKIKGDMGHTLIGQHYGDDKYSAGLYTPTSDNKFTIGLEKSILTDFEKLIATLAHEIGHIKILGEGRLKENDECLTDLITVFFGLGIFSANSAFKFYKQSTEWGYSQQGYLTQQEWGYALALFAYIREERKPDWTKFLTPNIQSDYKKSEDYIYNNTDKVLV